MGTSAVLLIVCMLVVFIFIIGFFFLVFRFILKKTNYQLKIKSENGEYLQISDEQKKKYLTYMIGVGILLGVGLFVFVR